jgi:acetyl-CoA carboxylase biotin carboxylase subunit
MNARIQVEHPVTEAITGLDLVAEQIRVADGHPLTIAQDDVRLHGHAIECRINAETVAQDFRPSPGVVRKVWFPSGVDIRVDTHIQPGSRIPPYYDSMIAKAIVWGATRAAAVDRMRQLMRALVIEGVDTNIALHRVILDDPTFQAGGFDTNFLAALLERSPSLQQVAQQSDRAGEPADGPH